MLSNAIEQICFAFCVIGSDLAMSQKMFFGCRQSEIYFKENTTHV
jgi:hypothetical protein